ncbi:MAG TPA: fused MFS/spermidine synthase [Candidatus Saccharimonadales bacterium]|nr:fused MFS/spermidine synthase [Candidatus Saccharimonadales bacterium]
MSQDVLWEGDTAYGHFSVVDGLYDNRPARVLYSGEQKAAQSGIAKDDNSNLLFDYNQRLLELAQYLRPQRILVIGGGALTLPTALLKVLPETRLDVVELDPGLTNLAYTYFDAPVDDRLAVAHTDGRSFLSRTAQTYDLIIVDAFAGSSIPRELKTVEAFQAYGGKLTPDGVVAMNVISAYNGRGSHIVREILAAAGLSFTAVELFLASHGYSRWLPQNFVVAAQKQAGLGLQGILRYDIEQLNDVSSEEALHD